jgi:predicted MFS family arabinose efflux permease
VLRPQAAVTAVFFLNGAVFSAWYARVPAIQERLDIGPGALGLALLGAPLGLLLAQPLVGATVARRGSRPLVAAAPLYLAAVVLPAVAVDTATLLLAALAVGAANGTLDIAMNAQGLAVERRAGRPLFGSLHAAFSFGALAGALAASAAAGAGVAPLPHLAAWAGLGGAVALALAPGLLDDSRDADREAPRLARPSRRLAALGAIAFCALLAEGAVFDWSGVFLTSEAGAGAGLAPLGLAAFSLAMGLGRLGTDRARARHGDAAVARAGAALAGAGLAGALAVATPIGAIAGFGLMGLGLAAVFPLALRGSSAQPDSAQSLAAISTVGYGGFLLGPPAIGVLADGVGLRAALLLVCVACATAASLASHLAERPLRRTAA